jgi:hypothetical protein
VPVSIPLLDPVPALVSVSNGPYVANRWKRQGPDFGERAGQFRESKLFVSQRSAFSFKRLGICSLMEVTLENFTPLSSLLGGALIGLAAAAYVLGTGRVAGVSGIVGGLFRPRMSELPVQAAFLAGLVAAPLLLKSGGLPTPITLDASLPILIVGGLLVGFGTRMGGGCTSGHGVCGIARFSPRSLVATAIFMASGALVVFVLRHLVGA